MPIEIGGIAIAGCAGTLRARFGSPNVSRAVLELPAAQKDLKVNSVNCLHPSVKSDVPTVCVAGTFSCALHRRCYPKITQTSTKKAEQALAFS